MLIDGGNGNTHIDAFQFYLIAWLKQVPCPEFIGCSAVDIDALFIGTYQDILLHAGAGPVIGELLMPVVGFGMRRKYLDHDAGMMYDIASLFEVTLITADRKVWKDIARCGDTDL